MRISSSLGPALALAVALVAAGCGNSPGSDDTLTGTIAYGNLGPVDSAALTLTGPAGKSLTTTHYGTFRVRGIPDGTYKLTASTLAGSQQWTLIFNDDSDFDLKISLPSWFDQDEWLALANIWPYVAVNPNDSSQGVKHALHQPQRRWAPGQVLKVAYAYGNSEYFGPGRSIAKAAIQEWAAITGMPMVEVPAAQCVTLDDCNLIVTWVDPNSLPNSEIGLGEAWVGRELSANNIDDPVRYASPYIQTGAVYIDLNYETDVPTINHEIAHVFGLGHVDDDLSLMYPFSGTTGQREYLSSSEEDYARILYTIAPAELASAQSTASGGEALAIFKDGHTEVRHDVAFKGVMQGP